MQPAVGDDITSVTPPIQSSSIELVLWNENCLCNNVRRNQFDARIDDSAGQKTVQHRRKTLRERIRATIHYMGGRGCCEWER